MRRPPMANLKAMPRFQLQQIKTLVQKTKRTAQKPKEGKDFIIKQGFEVVFIPTSGSGARTPTFPLE